MKERRFILLLIPLIAFLLTAFLVFNQAQANVNNNIRGLASSSQGYISFNCLDDDFFGRFPSIFPFYFHVTPCSVSNHGVHLDQYNNFSGSAWSPSLGYIYFDSTSTPAAPNYDFNVNCENTCNQTNNCIACYNEADERVYGWAYRHVPGDWIDLDSESPPVAMTNFTNPQPGIFSGYASSSIGQISFNCFTDDTCGLGNYKVYKWKLELKEMSAPNWSFFEACNNVNGARRVKFSWVKKSGTQTAYQIIVNTSNSTSSPVFDTGKIEGAYGGASQLVCPGSDCAWTPAYGTAYYWWLRLWDEEENETELFQFNTSNYGTLTDNKDYNNAISPNPNLTFTTYRHEFPTPFFTWSPIEILVGTSTDFMSDSYHYTSANPSSNPQVCVDGVCNFLWQVSNPSTAIINSPNTATTSILFTDNLPQSVTLSVTDPDGYICSYSSPVLTINFQLPIWREVKSQ